MWIEWYKYVYGSIIEYVIQFRDVRMFAYWYNCATAKDKHNLHSPNFIISASFSVIWHDWRNRCWSFRTTWCQRHYHIVLQTIVCSTISSYYYRCSDCVHCCAHGWWIKFRWDLSNFNTHSCCLKIFRFTGVVLSIQIVICTDTSNWVRG